MEPTAGMPDAQGQPIIQGNDSDKAALAIKLITAMMAQQRGGAPTAASPRLLPNPNGGFYSPQPSTQPLLNLLGVKQNVPVSSTNYLPLVKQIPGAQLPDNLPIEPGGQPYVSEDVFKRITSPEITLAKMGQKVATADGFSKDQLDAILSGDTDKISKAFNGKVPKDVLGDIFKANGQDAQADRFGETQYANFAKQVNSNEVSRFGNIASNQGRLNASERLFALIDQTAGNPNQLQTPEMSRAVASLISGGQTGVISNDELERMLPSSLRGKIKDFGSWLLNEPLGRDQQDFVHSFFDTAIRERNTIQRQLFKGLTEIAAGNSYAIQKYPDRAASFLKLKGLDDATINSVLTGNLTKNPYEFQPKSWDEVVASKAGQGAQPQVDMNNLPGAVQSALSQLPKGAKVLRITKVK